VEVDKKGKNVFPKIKVEDTCDSIGDENGENIFPMFKTE